ncbi:MAG: tRNA (adenosine(37)-N6)-threonylcarbamoyltransferase complex dimerization subunit type 1 TsaB [Clostridia bacterium]|nr:tRNA (adenosine(37)-N6)-threonylcarbamoyltransferase complex dimerization subunit type 1 TsaB [Clostridia bacterium]
MVFLAVDTSNDYLTVAVYNNGTVVSTYLPDCAMKHSVTLMTAIDETLDKANITLAECDFFTAAVGAGSFTGIRIGISAMKGFALALKKPTVPVTSFEAVAYNDKVRSIDKKTLCLVDALHDCYYACGYENGNIVYPPAFLNEAEALALVGEGYALCSCGQLPLALKAEVERVEPVSGLVNAALAKAERGEYGVLEALYVRKSSAELNLCR